MCGKYWESETNKRKQYFVGQFVSLAKEIASNQNISLNTFLGNLKDFTSFKSYLNAVFGADNSLANYLDSLSDDNKRDFFDRSEIQSIVSRNINNQEAFKKEEQSSIPVFITSKDKKIREFFNATIKGKKTRAYLDSFNVKGKKREVLRDLRGRFARKIFHSFTKVS